MASRSVLPDLVGDRSADQSTGPRPPTSVGQNQLENNLLHPAAVLSTYLTQTFSGHCHVCNAPIKESISMSTFSSTSSVHLACTSMERSKGKGKTKQKASTELADCFEAAVLAGLPPAAHKRLQPKLLQSQWFVLARQTPDMALGRVAIVARLQIVQVLLLVQWLARLLNRPLWLLHNQPTNFTWLSAAL
eukprot:5782073-Amphidinium_carterae.3